MVNSFLLFSAPFTIQRLCELMVEPRKNYSNSEKFMRGVEKVRDNQSYNKLWTLLFKSLVCKTQSCQKVFKQLANNEQQVALELAAKAQVLEGRGTRGILKFRVSEMAFLGVFKRYFPLWMPCCFIRIHTRLGTNLPSKCPRHSTTLHDLHVSQI